MVHVALLSPHLHSPYTSRQTEQCQGQWAVFKVSLWPQSFEEGVCQEYSDFEFSELSPKEKEAKRKEIDALIVLLCQRKSTVILLSLVCSTAQRWLLMKIILSLIFCETGWLIFLGSLVCSLINFVKRWDNFLADFRVKSNSDTWQCIFGEVYYFCPNWKRTYAGILYVVMLRLT